MSLSFHNISITLSHEEATTAAVDHAVSLPALSAKLKTFLPAVCKKCLSPSDRSLRIRDISSSHVLAELFLTCGLQDFIKLGFRHDLSLVCHVSCFNSFVHLIPRCLACLRTFIEELKVHSALTCTSGASRSSVAGQRAFSSFETLLNHCTKA